MKYFEFNKLYIIESVNPNEANGAYKQPANTLKQAMDSVNAPCELKVIDSAACFYKTLTQIMHDSWNGVRPILHFICHSLKIADEEFPRGLAIWNSQRQCNELITWKELSYALESINLASHFNLFVTLSVCEGLMSLENFLDENHRIPFCGILASPDPIKLCTSIICFKEYYVELMKVHDVNAAYNAYVKLLNSLNQYYIAKGIKPERIEQEFADDIYTKFARIDFKTNRSRPWFVRKIAIKELKKELHQTKRQLPEKLIQAFIGKNYQLLWSIHEGMQNYKFMLDLYPEQLHRFDLPQSIEDLKSK